MKRIKIILSLLISVILISSCREIKVSTIINKDGSFTRIMTITGDSSEVFKPGLPYPIDHTWEMEFKKDTANDNDYILTYTKSFNNSARLNEEFKEDTGWRKKLKRKIIVEKNFGFFYSYLVYKETIDAANPFKLIDYKDYLSKEDMLWLTGKKLALNSHDSARIKQAEDKAETYLKESLTDEIIATLKNGIEKLKNPAISPDQVDKYKDSIASKVNSWDYKSTLEFVDFYAKWTNNTEIYKLKEVDSTQFKILDNKMYLLLKVFEMEDYRVSVELPGIITETNSLSTTGSQVFWTVNSSSFLLEDFSMIVESRVINKWMFIIAGVILLLLIVFTIFKSGK